MPLSAGISDKEILLGQLDGDFTVEDIDLIEEFTSEYDKKTRTAIIERFKLLATITDWEAIGRIREELYSLIDSL